jgi:hypothetical protein
VLLYDSTRSVGVNSSARSSNVKFGENGYGEILESWDILTCRLSVGSSVIVR